METTMTTKTSWLSKNLTHPSFLSGPDSIKYFYTSGKIYKLISTRCHHSIEVTSSIF
jgi:hypothetical protein